MAYKKRSNSRSRSTTSYRSKSPARRRSSGSSRGGRGQVVKIVLQHQMMPAAPSPVVVQDGQGMSINSSKAKTSKL